MADCAWLALNHISDQVYKRNSFASNNQDRLNFNGLAMTDVQTANKPKRLNGSIAVLPTVKAGEPVTVAPATTPAAPEKRKSTRERVSKAIRDHVAADGLDLLADDQGKRGDLCVSNTRRDAQKLRDNADTELTRWSHTTADAKRGNGNELVPLPEPANPARRDYVKYNVEQAAGVLRHQASADAMDLVADAGALPLALELANDLKAKTRVEKMLAHQAAAFHAASLQFLERAKVERERASSSARMGGIAQAACVESARMMNAAARAASAFNDAVLTMQRLKTGWKQIVQVQHVTVKDGGKAVVGQNVKSRRSPGGRKARGPGSK
jgi:hypothetical protein